MLCALAVGLVLRATRHSDGPGPSSPRRRRTVRSRQVRTRQSNLPLASYFWRMWVEEGRREWCRFRRERGRYAYKRKRRAATLLSLIDSPSRMSRAGPFSAQAICARVRAGGYVFVEAAIPAGVLGTGPRTVTLEPQRAGVESFTWQLDVRAAAN